MRLYVEIFIFILCGASFVKSFSWQSCGKGSYPMKVASLDIFSNKTGILYVTGRGKVGINITSPIEGDLLVQKKFFWGWTTIPCVDNVGSCLYSDVCALSHYSANACPKEFTDNHLPCTCPILQEAYAAKRFPIDLKKLPNWAEEGVYKIRLKLRKDGKEFFCILMDIML